jgi:competence protein ComGC
MKTTIKKIKHELTRNRGGVTLIDMMIIYPIFAVILGVLLFCIYHHATDLRPMSIPVEIVEIITR